MVRRQIGQDGHIRGQGAGQFGLVAGQLQYHNTGISGRVDIQHATADIACHLAVAANAFQDMMQQRHRGGFTVGASDGHHLGRLVQHVPALGGQ